jgi:hypothetical protein
MGWVSAKITERGTPDLYKYLREEIQIQEVTPDIVVRQLDRPFLEGMSDDWVKQFYGFLAGREALWQKTWSSEGPARSVPIIRLEDGTHVVPFGKDGSPAAYLTAPFGGDDIPVVRQVIVQDDASRQFLVEKLKFGEFDTLAKLRKDILPKYSRTPPEVSIGQNIEDWRFIERALREATSEEKRQAVKSAVGNAAVVHAVNTANSEAKYAKPGQVYFTGEELAMYFSGNPNAWFLDEGYPKDLEEAFSQRGVSRTIRFLHPAPTPDSQGYEGL